MSTNKKTKVETCPSFPAAAKKTVALAVKLPGAAIKDSYSNLNEVLNDPKLQNELASALKAAGQALMDEMAKNKTISAGKSLSRIAKVSGKNLQKPMTSQIKKSPEYRRLEKGLKEFKCSFDNTPVGVFVNNNRTLLIIIGVVGAVGSGVAMYYTRTGDLPAKAFRLAELISIEIGAVSISAEKFVFTPSVRGIEVAIDTTAKWDNVKAKFGLSAAFKNDKITGVGGKSELSVELDPNTLMFVNASGSWAKGKDGNPNNIQGKSDIGVKHKISNRLNLQARVFGEYNQNDKARTLQYGITGSIIRHRLANSYDLKVDARVGTGRFQNRVGAGFGPQRTDHRVFVNLKLNFRGL